MRRTHTERLNGKLGDWRDEWNALNRSLSNSNPVLEARYVDLLLKHFGQGNEYLCYIDSGYADVACCVLRRRATGAWQSFMPSQAPLGPTLAASVRALNQLVDTVPNWVGKLDLLCIDPLLVPRDRSGDTHVVEFAHGNTMNIRISGGFDEYWDSRSRNLTHNIRRYTNRLTRANLEARLVQYRAPDEMAGAIARYGALESAGWKGDAGTAVHRDNAQGAFYTELMQTYAASGNATVYEYWLDDTLAASRLVIASESMAVILKTTYDETFSEFAPGRLLLRAMIQDVHARGDVSSIEFYTNATREQLAWATHYRTIRHLSFFPNRTTRIGYNLWRKLRAAVRAPMAGPIGAPTPAWPKAAPIRL
jgi:Acetyltransferase (GNAT) domain